MSRPGTAVAIGAVVLGIGFTGCGGDTPDTASSPTTAATTKTVDLKAAGAKVIKLDADWLVGTGAAV